MMFASLVSLMGVPPGGRRMNGSRTWRRRLVAALGLIVMLVGPPAPGAARDAMAPKGVEYRLTEGPVAPMTANTRPPSVRLAAISENGEFIPSSIDHEVSQAAQTIDFPQPADQVFDGFGLVDLPATASSGLPVVRTTSTDDVCSIFGTFAAIKRPGTCTVTVSQPGNVNYLAAPPVTRSFFISKKSQSITFQQPPNVVYSYGGDAVLSVNSTSRLNVSLTNLTPETCYAQYDHATISGAGTCTITATQDGNDYYFPAEPITRSFTILKSPQTISFEQPAPQVLSSQPAYISATSDSPLEIKLTSLTVNTCLDGYYSVYLIGAGTCTITASQAGNANYLPAQSVTRSFEVSATLAPQVNALAASARVHEQGFAALASFGSGAVMTYASRTAAAGPFGILKQHLNAAGAPIDQPLVVAAPGMGVGSPDVAALTEGHVVVWQGPDGSGTGIFAQRFSAMGTKVGGVIPVNSLKAGAQSRPRVAGLPGGGFAVVWQTALNATDDDVWMRLFSAVGMPATTEKRVNATTARRQNHPDIATLPSGKIAVVFSSEDWVGQYGLYHRLYTPKGSVLTDQLTTAALRQTQNPTPVITARLGSGARGGYAVAYVRSEVASMAGSTDVEVKTLTSTGSAAARGVKANTVTVGQQSAPAITSLGGGTFAVAFVTPDGSSTGIAVRSFGPLGIALGEEERANEVTISTQVAPALAPLGPLGFYDGTQFLAAWTTRGATAADRNDIASRLFQGP